MFLAVMAMFLFSCSLLKSPYVKSSYSIDYSEYTKKGFLLTESNSVSFSYEPIASITSLSKAGYEILRTKKNTELSTNYELVTVSKNVYGKFKNANINDALDEIYTKAISLGANGIINLKITYIPVEYNTKGEIIAIETYIVSGMAIKK